MVSLLLPALAVVGALVVLTLGLRRVEHEMTALRTSLRRSAATAVAADELRRTTAAVAERVVETEADARRRIHRPRVRRHRGDR